MYGDSRPMLLLSYIVHYHISMVYSTDAIDDLLWSLLRRFFGWTQAIYGISNEKLNILGGIDCDIDCIKCYAIAHEAVILPENVHFTKQEYLRKGGNAKKPIAIHAKVQDDNWKQGVVECGFNCLCMSCPCQPFAETSSKGGLFHENGMVTLHAMGFARFARPPRIIVEQVPGFEKHPHFSLFRQSLRFFGYEIHHSHTVPFGDRAKK